MRSLRARLFLTIGVVLAASIAASAVLSRRATLVEVREIVGRPVGAGGFDAVASDLAREVQAGGAGLQRALDAGARTLGRPLVVIDPDGRRVIASSSPPLLEARVRRPSGHPGDVDLEVEGPAGVSSIALRGAPARTIVDRDGRGIGVLLALPAEVDAQPGAGRGHRRWTAMAASWMVATAGVAAFGLILTFALSRRILQPVGELTAAVRRMEAGDLTARADRAALRDDEIGRLAHSFNAMASRLAEHERARRQMIADVAHELRSPVTNLRCAIEAIQDGLAEPDPAAIDGLHDETMFLQRVIADLQDLSLAEAGRLTLHLEPVHVPDVVARAAAGVIGPGGVPIVVDTAPDLPPALADASRLEQVLRNLLSNARRHAGDTGAIRIRAVATGNRIRIEVSDGGEGIAAEHLAHVFDRFYRADGSRSRATGGAGLGLAIVRQLIEAQGGRVSASSPGPGRGATFSVELPRHRTACP